ncbi:PIN domain-containing protein [Nocardiopsis sp. ARC36]|jgi:predicted nucleic acid-binding protein
MSRIFVDTNVLFPFSVMDLLLALTEDMVHEVIWTERLLAEWKRVIVREHHRSEGSAEAITSAIREYFSESCVPEDDYASLTDTMPGGDPDDRHHMAAAIAGRAHTLLTWDRGDFPPAPLAELGLRIVDPDTYLCELLDELPREVVTTVVRLAGEKRRPPKTPEDLSDDLAKAGVREFAERLRTRLRFY